MLLRFLQCSSLAVLKLILCAYLSPSSPVCSTVSDTVSLPATADVSSVSSPVGPASDNVSLLSLPQMSSYKGAYQPTTAGWAAEPRDEEVTFSSFMAPLLLFLVIIFTTMGMIPMAMTTKGEVNDSIMVMKLVLDISPLHNLGTWRRFRYGKIASFLYLFSLNVQFNSKSIQLKALIYS